VLPYLAVVRMLQGRVARPALLAEHGMQRELGELGAAFVRGDLRGFKAAVVRHGAFFRRAHCMHTWLHARALVVVWRNLVKRVWLLTRDWTRGGNILFTACVHHAAAAVMGEDLAGLAETEQCLMNLVDAGLMKGYLHMERHLVVLGKEDPFPKLGDVI
jgi:hypothetical protein